MQKTESARDQWVQLLLLLYIFLTEEGYSLALSGPQTGGGGGGAVNLLIMNTRALPIELVVVVVVAMVPFIISTLPTDRIETHFLLLLFSNKESNGDIRVESIQNKSSCAYNHRQGSNSRSPFPIQLIELEKKGRSFKRSESTTKRLVFDGLIKFGCTLLDSNRTRSIGSIHSFECIGQVEYCLNHHCVHCFHQHCIHRGCDSLGWWWFFKKFHPKNRDHSGKWQCGGGPSQVIHHSSKQFLITIDTVTLSRGHAWTAMHSKWSASNRVSIDLTFQPEPCHRSASSEISLS